MPNLRPIICHYKIIINIVIVIAYIFIIKKKYYQLYNDR